MADRFISHRKITWLSLEFFESDELATVAALDAIDRFHAL